jgi:Transposase DDE domain
VTQLGEPREVSPEALHQRMHKRAHAFLPEMIRHALAKGHSIAKVCDDGLLTYFPQVYLVDRTGFGLPESLKDLFPGAGGSAAKTGAKMQAAGDDKSSVFGPFALTPWNLPDNKYVATVSAFAPKGGWFLCDLGSCKVPAFARLAEAGAYFLRRLNHQTNIDEIVAGCLTPSALVSFWKTVRGNTVEQDICMGAKDQVGARLIACRVPETSVNERRRKARKNAKQKGYTPSQAHLTLFAWHLLITNVPDTIWKTETVIKVYPVRWQIALMFKSWKSYLHLAAINTKKADPPLGYLSGRMRLIVLT